MSLNDLASTRIRLLRKALGLSQEGLAKHLDITFQQLQKYETGKNNMSLNMLDKVAGALNVPIVQLVGSEKGESLSQPVKNSTMKEAYQLALKLEKITEPTVKSALLKLVDQLAAAECESQEKRNDLERNI